LSFKPTAAMLPRRFDSLFARLLLTQTLLALGFVVLFVVLFYAERSVTVAELEAQRWAPVLRQMAALPTPDAVSHAQAQTPAQQPQRPVDAINLPIFGPRMTSFARALRAQGVPVQEIAASFDHAEATIWLRVVTTSQGASTWLGVPGAGMLPNVPWRFFVAVVLGSALLVAASWWFTRRLTEPLRVLRNNLASSDPAHTELAPASLHARAAPELSAIDKAYRDLLHRYRRFEAERALLLAGVSHDLRSPLARIRMAAELLPDLGAAPDIARRRDAIVRNTQVADRLVGSFLDHVRAGELPMNETCDLTALAHAVAATQERPPEELQVQAPPGLVLRNVNALLLQRVMANLLDNAFAHGQAPVRLRLSARGDQGVEIAVGDAGAGIAVAQRGALLQAFARGDNARSKPGLGLGLATVNTIARRLGGELAFDSSEGLQWVRVVIGQHQA
jgi:two-component system, OmpR family, osmolarity sensor histidine kinase EnvZ